MKRFTIFTGILGVSVLVVWGIFQLSPFSSHKSSRDSAPAPVSDATGEMLKAIHAGDQSSILMVGDIKVNSSSVYLAEYQPPQLMVNFAYFQPTPCYQLRVEVSGPDAQNQFNLKAYVVAEKDKPCTLMALATPLHARLNLGSLPKGQHYTVFLNGDQIGEVRT